MKITQQLPGLPYDKKSLEPIITEETFDYHYGKHHAAYVNNLNTLIKDTPLVDVTIQEIIQYGFQHNDTLLFNNAAQHWNHSFFWHCLSPDEGKKTTWEDQKTYRKRFWDIRKI